MDLRVAIGMELLATDQADGVHRTPVGGDQKNRCFYTLWPELGVAVYIYIHLCIFIYLYFLTSILLYAYIVLFSSLHSYFTLSSSLFFSIFLSAAILWYTHSRSLNTYTSSSSYLPRSHLRSLCSRETLRLVK